MLSVAIIKITAIKSGAFLRNNTEQNGWMLVEIENKFWVIYW
jgi:hypothetical protein